MTEASWRLLACTNFRPQGDRPSCAGRGSPKHIEALEAEIRRRNLPLPVERSVCLGKCLYGPTLKATPGGEFYLNDWTQDIPGLVDRLERELGLEPAKPGEAGDGEDGGMPGWDLPPPGT